MSHFPAEAFKRINFSDNSNKIAIKHIVDVFKKYYGTNNYLCCVVNSVHLKFLESNLAEFTNYKGNLKHASIFEMLIPTTVYICLVDIITSKQEKELCWLLRNEFIEWLLLKHKYFPVKSSNGRITGFM